MSWRIRLPHRDSAQVKGSGMPTSRFLMAINEDDLIGLGLTPGPLFGDILDALQTKVLDGLSNDRESLFAAAHELLKERGYKAVKGGPGSGDRNHPGRLGEVGGSGSGGEAASDMRIWVEAPKSIENSPRTVLLSRFAGWLNDQPELATLPKDVTVTVVPREEVRKGVVGEHAITTVRPRLLNERHEVRLAYGGNFLDRHDAEAWLVGLPHEFAHVVSFVSRHGDKTPTEVGAASMDHHENEAAIEDIGIRLTDRFLGQNPGVLNMDALAPGISQSTRGGPGSGVHGYAEGLREVGGSGTRGDAGEVGGSTLFHHADRAFRESILKSGLQVSRDTTEWEGEPQKVYLTDNPVPATPNTDVWAVDTTGLPVVEHPELLLDIGPEDRPDERWFVSHRDVPPERLRLDGLPVATRTDAEPPAPSIPWAKQGGMGGWRGGV